ncbi:MAG: hypothetical protein IM636_01100, partial [Phenylobacterium sp.]|nr:hypothetical protein [Phenylobacterium sp.]
GGLRKQRNRPAASKPGAFASTRPIDQSQFRGPKREGAQAKWSPVD